MLFINAHRHMFCIYQARFSRKRICNLYWHMLIRFSERSNVTRHSWEYKERVIFRLSWKVLMKKKGEKNEFHFNKRRNYFQHLPSAFSMMIKHHKQLVVNNCIKKCGDIMVIVFVSCASYTLCGLKITCIRLI